MDRLDYKKLKIMYTTKEMVSKLEKRPHTGKYLLAIHQTKD
jgi:hypothetical protein